jgi:hypothetical protein
MKMILASLSWIKSTKFRNVDVILFRRICDKISSRFFSTRAKECESLLPVSLNNF